MAIAPLIPIAMMAMTAATTAAGAMSAMAAGRAQESIYKYNAAQAMNVGNARATQSEQDARRKLAQARAAYGAAGVALEGSPLEVMQDLATQGELDRQNILWQAKTSAAQDIASGKMAMSEAKGKAFGTILTGLGQMGGQAWDAYGTPPGGGEKATSPIAETYTYPSATLGAHY